MKPSIPSWVASKGWSDASLGRLYPQQDVHLSLIFSWFDHAHKLAKRSKRSCCCFFAFSKFLTIKVARTYFRKLGERKLRRKKKSHT